MANNGAAKKALAQLEKALRYARGAEGKDLELFEQFRNSVFQTFEYSYELVTKLLRRTLAERAATADEVLSLSFPDLLRLAARSGMIGSVEQWLVFRVVRNKTSHGYEETFATEAYSQAEEFLRAASALLDVLERS
jgi:nucleotidyltransferase substrate binding protein (TIGR01987 family)